MEKKLDLRVEKTYWALHNAFTDLLEEMRFDEITVQELCERAMIRRTTFYKHFADKYEYFTFYVREITASFQDQLPPDVMDDDIYSYLLHMSRELLQFIEKHRGLVNNVANSPMFPVLFSNLTEQVRIEVLATLRRMDSLGQMDTTQAEGIAAFYSSGLLNSLWFFFKRGTPLSAEQLAGILSAFLPQTE